MSFEGKNVFLFGAVAVAAAAASLALLALKKKRVGAEEKESGRHVMNITWYSDEFSVCKMTNVEGTVNEQKLITDSLKAVGAWASPCNKNAPVFAALTATEYSLIAPTSFVSESCSGREDAQARPERRQYIRLFLSPLGHH